MRVFLTGASGYIGSAVADALRANGHDLTGLARTDATAARLERAAVGRRAEALGWRPHGPDPLEDLERGSYATRAA